MNYCMRKEDIFNHVGEKEARFVQCLSSDFAAGAGIAVSFNHYFDIKNRLRNLSTSNMWQGKGYMVKLIGIPVYNLITKYQYYNKPTYKTITQSLESMRDYLIREMTEEELNKLIFYMPKIGCGLDKLSWIKVEQIIQDVFKDLPINIVVCYL